jgi:hypothetical protein
MLCRICKEAEAVILLRTTGRKLNKYEKGYCKPCFENEIRRGAAESFFKPANHIEWNKSVIAHY